MPSINLWHNDLWKVSLSNIPGLTSPADLAAFEQFIKSVNFPEYSGENENTDQFIGFRAQHPIGHSLNREVGILQMEIKIDEYFKNYLCLFAWMQNIRYGQNIDTELLRDYVCKDLSVSILDNMKRVRGRFSFTSVTCIGLSAIPMSYGTGEEVTVNANFDYEQILWIPETGLCNN